MLNDLVPFAKVANVIKTGSVLNGVRITLFKLYLLRVCYLYM